MLSNTLNQFQNSMYELAEFGRGKDKVKRKARQVLGGINKAKRRVKAMGNNISPKLKNLQVKGENTSKAAGKWLGNPIDKAKAGFQTNNISAAAGKSQNAAIQSTGSLGNKARKVGNAISNVAGTRAGKIGMGLAAGGALALGAAKLLKDKNKKKK